MATPKRLSPARPVLPKHDTPDELPHERLEDHEDYWDLNLVGTPIESASNVGLKQLRLTRASLHGAQLHRLDLTDVGLAHCDLSNAEWFQASGDRVALVDCRLTGFRAPKGSFKNLHLKGCGGRYVHFTGSRFRQTLFEDCDLSEANFQGADLTDCVFRGCTLERADFSGAKLSGTDFRGSRLEGALLPLSDLKGALLDPLQALAMFERLTGVRVEALE